MANAPTLSDGCVTIRALDERDIAGFLEQCVDPLSIEWTQVPVPYGLQNARDFVERVAPEAWDDGSQWIFCVEHQGRYAGNIALRDQGHGVAEIAYNSHPRARGTGAVEGGLRLLLEWGFATQGLSTVVWRANVGNWASRKLAWRLGFSLDGVLRHSLDFRGELVDEWVGTLLAGEERRPSGRWFKPPVLEGAGVRLRPFTEADVPRVVEACSDERTQHWLGRMPSPYTEDHARRWFQRNTEDQATGRGATWAVTDPSTDLALASVAVKAVTEQDCMVGYWAHPDARGHGVVRAAVEAVTTWAFAELGVGRVRIATAVDNTASRRVAEACGYTETGRERMAAMLRTGPADVALYDVLAEEWSHR